ncbi:MAG: hypothetical protein CMJ57_08180 [Planctomycetaceae bacterium]|nr:hypothetical protein [Planctomycetaceae bacterium]
MAASIISVPEDQTAVIHRPLSCEAQPQLTTALPVLAPHPTPDQPLECTHSSELLPRNDRVKLRGSLRRG